MKILVAALVLATTGCLATVPAPIAEGTEVLKPHATGLTLAAAGAGFAGMCNAKQTCLSQFGVGGEARVRIGLRGNQEIGASGFAAFVVQQGDTSSLAGQAETRFVGGGELSYKIAPVPWFAIVAGAGALDEGGTPVIGGDLALLVAPYTSGQGTQVYTGARGSFGIPIFSGGTGTAESLVVPVGLSLKSGSDVRVFFEGGLAIGFDQYKSSIDPKTSQDATYLGGYGAIGVLLMVR
jgi:hypothetical protein